MMGKSHQKGWIVARGRKWYGYFRRKTSNPITQQISFETVPVVLGLKSQMSKFEARDALESEIAKLTGQLPVDTIAPSREVTFGWFVRKRYFLLKQADWSEETAKVKKYLINKDLLDDFEEIPLENFDKFSLQVHLNQLAMTRSRDRVLQIRAYLRDIFFEAVDQDYLQKDPARKVKVPKQLRESDKTTLTWEQLRKVLGALSLRDRVLLELDMTDALRPSELFALRWKRFNHQKRTMTLAETVYKGKIRTRGKTKKSLGVIHLPRKLAADLSSWKRQCPDKSPEAFIFANKLGGFRCSSNYRKRVLHAVAEELKLPRLTFQIIRRSIATLAQKKGTVKDVQGLLRHSRAATTTDIYMQEIPESVQATVDSINQELRKKTRRKTERKEGSEKFATNLLPNATKPERAMSVSA
jgi:integrase